MVTSRAPPSKPATPIPSSNSGDKLPTPSTAAAPASSTSSTNCSSPGVRAVTQVRTRPPIAPIAAFLHGPKDNGGTTLPTNTALAAPVTISMTIGIRNSAVNIAHPSWFHAGFTRPENPAIANRLNPLPHGDAGPNPEVLKDIDRAWLFE